MGAPVEDDPLIVLIGGTAGCGKTTLANRLVAHLDLDHRIGTGFIRAVLQSQTDPAVDPLLFRHTYESDDPLGNLQAQALRLLPAVRSCVDRARAEGTSLVVEGTHLLPDLYHDAGARFVVLEPPDPIEHRRRLHGRHARRSITIGDLAAARAIGDLYRSEAARLGVPSLHYGDNLAEIASLLAARPPG